jgi:hypothetical protein
MRILFFAFLLTLAGLASARAASAVSVFGAWTLDNEWDEVFLAPGEIRFENAGLAGLGLSRTVWRPHADLALELEGQLVRHFGDQDHWEVNAPLATFRWTGLPRLGGLDPSFSFGLGFSVASETPALEKRLNGDSQPAMIYWKVEIGADLPRPGWRLFGRLHHRSTGYGLFGDEGGANAIGLGLRRRF